MTDCQTNLTKEECQEPAGVERTGQRAVFRPHVDIIDGPEQVSLRVNMPGVNENSVDLTLEKNILTIHGRVDDSSFSGFELTHAEYGVGDYERSFRLTNEVDREGIEAKMKDGVLRVQLQKSKQAIQQKIPVKLG